MSKLGTILEMEKNRVLIMTGECDFVFIKRTPDMFVGQQVKINKKDLNLVKVFVKRVLPAVAGVAAVFVALLLYFQASSPDMMKNTYAFVDLDINPSIEFMIDSSNNVQQAVPINKDAKTVLAESNFINVSIDKAVSEVIDKSKELGFVKSTEDDAVLISAALNARSDGYEGQKESRHQKLAQVLGTIKTTLENETSLYKVIETKPETKEQALKSGISMGRQVFWEDATKNGIGLTLSEVEESSVSYIIKNLEDSQPKVSNKPQDTATPKITATEIPPKVKPTGTNTPKPVSKPTSYSEKVVYDNSAPEISGKVANNKIILSWTPVDGASFQYYKVVISKSASHPKYPDNGYLYVISDVNTTSAVIDNSQPYNGGDFGEYLTPGQKYYFSVTAVYDNKKVPGNTLFLKFPGSIKPSPTSVSSVDSASSPKVTSSVVNNKITLKWTPAKNEGFVYYKVVISKNNAKPKYPDDGYLTFFEDINVTQTTIGSESYNGGDIGGSLTSGQKYYFAITYVYQDTKISSNVLYLTYPGE